MYDVIVLCALRSKNTKVSEIFSIQVFSFIFCKTINIVIKGRYFFLIVLDNFSGGLATFFLANDKGKNLIRDIRLDILFRSSRFPFLLLIHFIFWSTSLSFTFDLFFYIYFLFNKLSWEDVLRIKLLKLSGRGYSLVDRWRIIGIWVWDLRRYCWEIHWIIIWRVVVGIYFFLSWEEGLILH